VYTFNTNLNNICSLAATCPFGWWQFMNKCYSTSYGTGAMRNWTDAAAFCRSQHPAATLASLESKEELDDLTGKQFFRPRSRTVLKKILRLGFG
jgi:hypothetical protein